MVILKLFNFYLFNFSCTSNNVARHCIDEDKVLTNLDGSSSTVHFNYEHCVKAKRRHFEHLL